MPTPRQRLHLALVALVCAACSTTTATTPTSIAMTETDPDPASVTAAAPERLHPALRATIEALLPTLEAIPAERRPALEQLAAFIRERRAAGAPARLIFICTHNSRRSHMAQLWAMAAATWYGIDGVETYSGGTEATAFNPRAVAAIERAGFAIARDPDAAGDNPRYQVGVGPEGPTVTAFSKTWQDPSNPREDFAAVMTCSQADEACPFVRGAALRVALPYEDPKLADDTPEEAARYDARVRQIGGEMLLLFRLLAES